MTEAPSSQHIEFRETSRGANLVTTPPSEAFINSYIATTRGAAEQALKSLDSSINWALTVTLGVLAFVTHSVVFGDALGTGQRGLILAILSIVFSMQIHFAIRAAKNYLNIVRFAKLERETLKFSLGLSQEKLDSNAFTAIVQAYHVEWRSPLTVPRIVTKVLFEFGFSYLLGFSAFMFWFVAKGIPGDKWRVWVIALLATGVSVLFELLIFSNSPYINNPAPDDDARRKA